MAVEDEYYDPPGFETSVDALGHDHVDVAEYRALGYRPPGGGAGEVDFDEYAQVLYATDGSIYQARPAGVVCPRDIEDVRAAVRVAADHGTSRAPARRGVVARGPGRRAGLCRARHDPSHGYDRRRRPRRPDRDRPTRRRPGPPRQSPRRVGPEVRARPRLLEPRHHRRRHRQQLDGSPLGTLRHHRRLHRGAPCGARRRVADPHERDRARQPRVGVDSLAGRPRGRTLSHRSGTGRGERRGDRRTISRRSSAPSRATTSTRSSTRTTPARRSSTSRSCSWARRARWASSSRRQ